jgi:hypothetical protein
VEESGALGRLESDLPIRKEATMDEEIREEQLDKDQDDDVEAHLRDKWAHPEADDNGDEDRNAIKK